jgi:hypothetical protein
MPEKIRLEYSLEKVKQAVGKWLHLDDTEIIDVMLATHIANRFNADPIHSSYLQFWLICD